MIDNSFASKLAPNIGQTNNKARTWTEFAKDFIAASPASKNKYLDQLDNNGKQKLFEKIKQEYISALSGKAKGDRMNAAMQTGVRIISGMQPCMDHKQLALNVLKFMNENIKYSGNINNAAGRDACRFSGEQVLAEGNYNGCAEATKLFEALYSRAAQNKGFNAVKCTYVSSFDVDKASLDVIAGDKTPWGHAIIELKQGEVSTFINAAMLEHPMLKNGPITSMSELIKGEVFLFPDSTGKYKMTIGDHKETFMIFNKGTKFNLQSNDKNKFDPATSDGATRRAVRDHLNSKITAQSHIDTKISRSN